MYGWPNCGQPVTGSASATSACIRLLAARSIASALHWESCENQLKRTCKNNWSAENWMTSGASSRTRAPRSGRWHNGGGKHHAEGSAAVAFKRCSWGGRCSGRCCSVLNPLVGLPLFVSLLRENLEPMEPRLGQAVLSESCSLRV